ncbi:uncharacterized protein LOC117654224 [Thrips palmi]|uniref:Uncharacterized protein LOC117654224 n=1 Tax=Thrips palmi TaxID=161013 RepID=A0A6P9AFY9_THRPL|nr:uncharacterized protein LOC117654224 [Thrips palmi]
MSMVTDLGFWIWLLRREGPRGLRQRIFAMFVCSMVPQVFVGVCAAMMGTAALLSADLVEASNPANMACGFYSCLGANVTFYRRRDRTLAILRDLQDVAKQIQKGADEDPVIQKVLAHAHRMHRRMTNLQTYFGSAMIGSVWLTVLASGGLYCAVWPAPTSDEAARAGGLAQAVLMLVGCTGFYAAGSLIGVMVTSLMGQYGVLGVWLRRARTNRDVEAAIALHQKILCLARKVEELYSDSITHFMLCCFSAPLISTLQVLNDEMGMLTFTAAFINLAVFMPLAILSQSLTDVSLTVRENAFHAAFEVDDDDTPGMRRALLLMEILAERPARLSFKGLGPLNLSSAGNALRTWYSCTSVLANAGPKKG